MHTNQQKHIHVNRHLQRNDGYPPLTGLRPERFDRPDILKRLNAASRRLAELKGVAASMPNQDILISTLGLQEAKDSSAIENIVTTHDELFREAAFPDTAISAATTCGTRPSARVASRPSGVFSATSSTGNSAITGIPSDTQRSANGNS